MTDSTSPGQAYNVHIEVRFEDGAPQNLEQRIEAAARIALIGSSQGACCNLVVRDKTLDPLPQEVTSLLIRLQMEVLKQKQGI